MDHIVTLDSEANEIEDLIGGTKSMIIHGANVKSAPYGIVTTGDILYFVDDGNPDKIKARARVSSVFNSCRMTYEESFAMVIRNQHKLCLPDKLFYKWAGKRYLVLIELEDFEEIHPFILNNRSSVSPGCWYAVGII